jgi:hypothetical protein
MAKGSAGTGLVGVTLTMVFPAGGSNDCTSRVGREPNHGT